MPTTDRWLVFLGSAIVFAVTPGPAMLYVLARSLHGGLRDGVLSAVGNSVGTMIHVLAAAVGLATLLAASPVLFAAVKFLGAGYLAVLGILAIRNRRQGHHSDASAGATTTRSPVLQGVVVETLNPKTALYFMALLPHFVASGSASPAAAFCLLGLIVVAIALTTDVVVACAASRLHERLAADARWQVCQRTGSGVVMIGLGTFVAVT
ncbi:LysE family translocator [Phytoactinopolyspora halotolerans]|uniref:LysE family translocator n=1 Tax=Phytoactinopolyspora halotolerans TaxID=1981512 RepID=A0A6L9S7V7_9ACTN|nr:LysE family translocator [Phytoactinopolyspora halotolerans]NEE01256.1 LysE family translocator [Phytoactinopolyspora halotolerans]